MKMRKEVKKQKPQKKVYFGKKLEKRESKGTTVRCIL